MTVLDIRHLNVSYVSSRGIAQAVRDLSLTIQPSETYGLVGESGCGKSTVALAIMRYLPRRTRLDGQILFQDADIATAPPAVLGQLRGNRIAMVYQDPQSSLNPVLTIEKQLVEVITAHEGATGEDARRRVIEMLEQVRMPDPAYVLQRYPHQLSGGMQQRVVIAMALLLRPDLVVMDEPTTGLDVTIEAGVLDLLNDLRREFKMAILFISHNLGVIARICDRVGVMYAGELIEEAPVRQLFDRPHHPYTTGLLRCVPQAVSRHTSGALYSIPGRVPPLTALPRGCTFAARCAFAEPGCTQGAPQLESVAAGHAARCFRWRTVIEQPAAAPVPQPPSTPAKSGTSNRQALLTVSNLKVYFTQLMGLLGLARSRRIRVIDDVSFSLEPQRTLGIVGESGCGKSTIAGAVAGLKPVTSGRIDFGGSDFTRPIARRSRAALRQMQMVFQNSDSSLNPRHTVEKTLRRPLRCFNIVPRGHERAHIIGLLKAVNLDETYLDRRPRQLSGGEKQRVAIARAFAGEPQLILCDEPISSLDVSVQAAVLNLLQQLQRERRVALMFIAHDLNVVRYLSDEVAVIYLGKICEIGPAEAIFQPPYHPYTEALVSAIPAIHAGAQPHAIRLEGSVPSPANPPSGCRFHTRCPRKIGSVCEQQEPLGQDVGDDHIIYCHIPLSELRALQTQTEAQHTQ